jgi:hypothetical protein
MILGITNTVFTLVKSKQTTFMGAWTEMQLQEKTHSTSVQRKTLTDNHKKYLREWFNQYLRYNPGQTNDIRAQLDVPIPDTTHTPIEVGMKCWDIPSGTN